VLDNILAHKAKSNFGGLNPIQEHDMPFSKSKANNGPNTDEFKYIEYL
jgi:hypothetical protein